MLVKTTALLSTISLLLAGLILISTASGQTTAGPPIELRIKAQPHADGRVEFGLLYGDERLLPELRYLTPQLREQRVGVWLRSSVINLVGKPEIAPALAGGGGETAFVDQAQAWDTPGFGLTEERVYVAVVVHTDGRIEFALDHNGQRLSPDARYLTPELIATALAIGCPARQSQSRPS